MKAAKPIKLTGKRVVNAPTDWVFHILIDPAEQLKWNSVYLSATFAPPGEISDGTVMTGKFRGSGKATVTFENVHPEKEFTHYSAMSLPLGLPLGSFRHTYSTRAVTDGTEITQTIRFQPRCLGRAMAGMILRSFRKRLPVSFDEITKYVNQAH